MNWMRRAFFGIAAACLIAGSSYGQTDTQPMSMQFSPAVFQKRFNDAARQRKMEFRINGSPTLKPSTAIADQWVYRFSDRIILMAMVNRKDGTIRSLTYMASGDGTIQSGADVMFALITLVAATDPSLEKATANRLASRLMDAYTVTAGVEQVRNGIRYGAVVLPTIGLVVAINPVSP